jgi:predicted Fe-Mo cluster-binding NifX family protein
MDFASQLMVIDLEDKIEIGRHLLDIPNLNVIHKTEFLKNQGINLLICGAISIQMNQILTSSQIEVIPFIRGSIQNVLAAYIEGELHGGNFYMPGCRNNKFGPNQRGHQRQRRFGKRLKN